MHSCTFDTAFVFLNIFIVLYILGELTEYMLGEKKSSFLSPKSSIL